MKNSITSLCAGLLLGVSVVSSRANTLVSTNFDVGYTPGALAGQSSSSDVGFGPAFGRSSSNGMLSIVSGGLTYSNGTVNIPGGTQSARLTVTDGGASNTGTRGFSSALTGQNIYERIVVNGISPSTNSGTYLEFAVNVNGFFSNPSFVGLYSGSLGAGINGNSAFAAGGQFTAGNNLIIAEYVFDNTTGTYDKVNFFLNPSSTTEPTPTATASLLNGANGPTSFNGFDIGIANMGGGTNNVEVYGFDSFAIGTSFADVTSVPEPSTWTAGVASVAMLALALRRRLKV